MMTRGGRFLYAGQGVVVVVVVVALLVSRELFNIRVVTPAMRFPRALNAKT